ncbi:uncharacterized protein LOC123654778 [Melitaea cinxia]|uniref:uncharacterized protein LOC123654778 n=1 Tax=Melitaea cinxia TaxID=113334 RepID=UPI001E273D3B|nr:uncharacterized protein LOC123654778 [Melitaea cinxia]
MLKSNTNSNRDNSSNSSSEDISYGTSAQGPTSEQRSVFNRIGDLLQPLVEDSPREDTVPESSLQSVPCITNLNSLLADIHVRYIALKKEDFQLHYRVQFAGSHYDGVRIKKPDEFDVDIVIGLPVNFSVDQFNPEESDIVIEQNSPGFVQLRAGLQYQKILERDGVDCVINKTAYQWLDDKKYILRSKFTSWFKSVGNRALNQLPKRGLYPICYVDEVGYTIRTSESGPAWTLLIEAPGFKLDVDLVPALRFPEDRWLEAQ